MKKMTDELEISHDDKNTVKELEYDVLDPISIILYHCKKPEPSPMVKASRLLSESISKIMDEG